MKMKLMRIWLKKYQTPITCVRFLSIYWLFLLIAKYSRVFNTGLVPKDWFSTVIIAFLMTYRLLSIFFIPAMLFLWIIRQADARP